MKIDLNTPSLALVSASGAASSAGRTGGASTQGSSGDRISLSASGTTIDSLTAQAMNLPAVRLDKVASLRESVNNGSYQLDPHAIASAMIAAQKEEQ